MINLKKVVIFGGGTGISHLLTGLKLFPVEVTAVISVSDDGSSTGKLKEELNIPAVGDVGKVLLAMANVDEEFKELLRYRFTKESSLLNHPVRNILLAALIDLKGNLTDATKYMCKLLNVNGTILPLSEDKVELIGESKNGAEYKGETSVSNNARYIKKLRYDHNIKVSNEVIKKVLEADLIILSSGSLYTSILPHLIAPEIQSALKNSAAPIMYVSNLVTQPGETDNFTVADHVKVLNEYMKTRKVDVVITNNGEMDHETIDNYSLNEHKSPVVVDIDKLKKLGVKVISEKLATIENGMIRHDSLKTSYHIFSYLMDGE